MRRPESARRAMRGSANGLPKNARSSKKSLENQAQLGHARALVVERRALEAERQTRDRAELLSRSERERAAAERAERGFLATRDQARKAYERSAQGLADVQKGLDELHRNANGERRAKARLLELRELLSEPNFPIAEDSYVQRTRGARDPSASTPSGYASRATRN